MKNSLRAVALILLLSLFLMSVGCKEDRSALSLMNEFLDTFSYVGITFSKDIPEGEAGYVDESFFVTLYGESDASVSDYAVFMLTDIDSVGECAIMFCYSEYDAIRVMDMLFRRIDLMRSLGGSINTECARDAVVIKRGKRVAMCALDDNGAAKDVLKKLLN